MVKARRNGNTVCARIEGELDHNSASTVRGDLDALIADERVKALEIDLSGLAFMDSSGIGVLLGRYKEMARRGGKMALIGPSAHIDRILQLSGVYQIMERRAGAQEEKS